MKGAEAGLGGPTCYILDLVNDCPPGEGPKGRVCEMFLSLYGVR